MLKNKAPCGGASGLARLHVRGDGAALGQTLEAFVGVVQEDPVLGLEVWLCCAGCRQKTDVSVRRRWGALKPTPAVSQAACVRSSCYF